MKNISLLKNRRIIETIIDHNVVFIALLTLPTNYVVYLSLASSNNIWVKIAIPLLSAVFFIVSFIKKKLPLQFKIWLLSIPFMLIPIILLFFKLVDLSVFWFTVSTTFLLYVFDKKKFVYLISISVSILLIVAILTLTDDKFIPKTGILSCYKQCMIARFVSYIIIGVLIHHVFIDFMREINRNISTLEKQATNLQEMNKALLNEIAEKKKIQSKALGDIILAEEKERKRIAADLHDGLGPVMSSINLYYQAYIDEKNPEKKKEIEGRLKKIIGNAISDVSKISHNISPLIVENNGLIVALENFIDQLNIHKNLKINFSYENIFRFDIKKELSLYRAVTELINNTIKYAQANIIHINISIQNKQIHIDYTDNGIGFDKLKITGIKNGLGLQNITSRLASLEGSFSYNTTENGGFHATMILPYS